jgi:hypothetical protein
LRVWIHKYKFEGYTSKNLLEVRDHKKRLHTSVTTKKVVCSTEIYGVNSHLTPVLMLSHLFNELQSLIE